MYRVFDSVFAEGIEAIFRFALALMKKSEDALLALNFEGAVEFLKMNLFDVYLVSLSTAFVREPRLLVSSLPLLSLASTSNLLACLSRLEILSLPQRSTTLKTASLPQTPIPASPPILQLQPPLLLRKRSIEPINSFEMLFKSRSLPIS